jgi:dTDP-4-dehydrorhamnose reductase
VRVLVFGAAGQVGHEVCRAAWPASVELTPLDRSSGDITKPAAVDGLIRQQRPDLVINLAAYTAVDRAESEPELAWAVNCAGAAHIASACGDHGTALIQLSTDYVFDGTKPGPYSEDDPVNPLGVYGCSKEAGERAVRAAAERHTMLRLGAERPILRVVADQHGCPTAARDIASALVAIARQIEQRTASSGTFHFAGDGATSWHGFAEEIVEHAARSNAWRSQPKPRVEAITTDQYPTPAQRPMNSVLDCRKIGETFGITPPPWRASLQTVLDEILAANRGG